MVGAIANLYEKLNESYIQPNQTKETLLKPRLPVGTSSVPLLRIDNTTAADRKYYTCTQCRHSCFYISDDPRTICPNCGRKMEFCVRFVAPPGKQVSTEVGFVKGVVTYMIMDNLMVTPMSTISSITLLNRLKVKDVGILQEMEVTLGMGEAVKLLKASLHSKKVLTDVFSNNTE